MKDNGLAKTLVCECGPSNVERPIRLPNRERPRGFSRSGLAIAILLVALSSLTAAEELRLRGRVTDVSGRGVGGATVCSFWSANGARTKTDGTRYDFADENDIREYWSREGEMSPYLVSTQTDATGSFSLDVDGSREALMVIGPNQRTGGVLLIPPHYAGRSLTCVLTDLISVRAKYTWDRTLPNVWAHSYVSVVGNETRVLANKRIITCGSYGGILRFRVPQGRYEIRSYGSTDGGETLDLTLKDVRGFTVDGDATELDLGNLHLSPAAPSAEQIKAESLRQGHWVDLKHRFGQHSPNWHVSFATGVPNDVSVTTFRGKWLLLSFWAFGCPSCLKDKLPDLAKFYRSNSDHRDKFEIIAICIDPDRELETTAALEDRLEPFVKHLWDGKPLPFPVIVDSSHQTWKNFGLSELGSTVLIDPNGILVDGGIETLAKLLP